MLGDAEVIAAIYARKSARPQISCDRVSPTDACGAEMILGDRRGGSAALAAPSWAQEALPATRARALSSAAGFGLGAVLYGQID
jgi:hypothetical protein